jgi:hypothetical protein
VEVGGQPHSPAAALPEKDTSAPIEWQVTWAPELVWRFCTREKSDGSAGVEPQFRNHPPWERVGERGSRGRDKHYFGMEGCMGIACEET